MANVGRAIRQFLVAQSGVTELVGQRVVREPLLQDTQTPAITYRKISTTHFDTINGSKAGLAQTRLTIDCFAWTPDGADEIAEAVRLSGILDLLGVTNGVDIRGVSIDSGASHYEEPSNDGSHEYRYVTSTDYMISYIEEV